MKYPFLRTSREAGGSEAVRGGESEKTAGRLGIWTQYLRQSLYVSLLTICYISITVTKIPDKITLKRI